jgi:hypothetical protein
VLSNSLAFKRGVAAKTNVSSWRAAAAGRRGQHRNETMNSLINFLTKSGLLTRDLDYHLICASMVIIFLFFGYQKWFEYEAQVLITYISNGPLISWMYPVFGIRGASWFLGVSELARSCS